MSQPIIPNRWHLRRVADSAARSCFVCYKPTPRVMITPENKDFFYICQAHLSDRNFCSPIIDGEELAAKKKKEELDREIEAVKREYEEKMKRRREKGKGKEKEKDEEDGKKQQKEDGVEDEEDEKKKKAEKEKDDKIQAIKAREGDGTPEDETPRIYELHRNFYNMRLERLRNMELAKRNRERMKDAAFFPSAPKGDP